MNSKTLNQMMNNNFKKEQKETEVSTLVGK